jgi:very-short-patch-repair endonuclease
VSSQPSKTPQAGGGSYPDKQIGLHNLSTLRTFRKALRSHLTPAEAKLWTLLKQSQLDGRKFRRQHSVGNYILDFYCPSERLGIELDGEVHNGIVAQEYDRERDLFLLHVGINVLRFENKLVFQQTEGVLLEIKSHFGWFDSSEYKSTSSLWAAGETTPCFRETGETTPSGFACHPSLNKEGSCE